MGPRSWCFELKVCIGEHAIQQCVNSTRCSTRVMLLCEQLVELLLEKGADPCAKVTAFPFTEKRCAYSETQDSDGNSALIACVQGKLHALVKRTVMPVPATHCLHTTLTSQATATTPAKPTNSSRCPSLCSNTTAASILPPHLPPPPAAAPAVWARAGDLWLSTLWRCVRQLSRGKRRKMCSMIKTFIAFDYANLAARGCLTCWRAAVPRAICSQQVQVRYGRARLLPALSALGCDCVAAEELAQKGGGQPDESVVQHGGWQGRVAPWQDRKKRREAQAQAQVQDNGGMRDA